MSCSAMSNSTLQAPQTEGFAPSCAPTCAQVTSFGPTLNFRPFHTKAPSVPSDYQRTLAAKLASQGPNFMLRNVDGLLFETNPCNYRCANSHLSQVQPVMFQANKPYTLLGGIISAPAFYPHCVRRGI